jgi:hypothetical protein
MDRHIHTVQNEGFGNLQQAKDYSTKQTERRIQVSSPVKEEVSSSMGGSPPHASSGERGEDDYMGRRRGGAAAEGCLEEPMALFVSAYLELTYLVGWVFGNPYYFQ